ncbi:MAG: putative zinc-binding metallopeptidase [Acidobacteria bacterium]|nr:putative zinc-binding metallopeptidase [Acidobacteriota bacterium]
MSDPDSANTALPGAARVPDPLAPPESRPGGKETAAPTVGPAWLKFTDEQLLDLRMCDLGVTIEGSVLEKRIAQLYDELAERGITFRPYFWLSDEWFTPDDVPGIAIPFYLAHPRLARLEQNQMFEVEGGTHSGCLRILRHEAGHAIDNAYLLQRRRNRRALFGSSATPYPEWYTPKPYSRSFVLHLDYWYAQSHPDEDFAETFAVWLNPRSDWRRRYHEWPALKKLEYVDVLMRETATKPALVTTKRLVDPLHRIRRTLREHYRRKAEYYGSEYPDFYDRDLRRLFSDAPEHAGSLRASRFITRIRQEVRRTVARATGVYQYTIDQVLEEMTARCDELGLQLAASPETAKTEFMVVLTVQTMNYLHSGRHRVVL